MTALTASAGRPMGRPAGGPGSVDAGPEIGQARFRVQGRASTLASALRSPSRHLPAPRPGPARLRPGPRPPGEARRTRPPPAPPQRRHPPRLGFGLTWAAPLQPRVCGVPILFCRRLLGLTLYASQDNVRIVLAARNLREQGSNRSMSSLRLLLERRAVRTGPLAVCAALPLTAASSSGVSRSSARVTSASSRPGVSGGSRIVHVGVTRPLNGCPLPREMPGLSTDVR
jgi:hypothetical protein